MRFGICTNSAGLLSLRNAGFDFGEFTLNEIAALTDGAFIDLQKLSDKIGISIEASNGFFPWSMRVIGSEADQSEIKRYVRRAISRAAEIGIAVSVVGNGGSRRIPDGMELLEAERQFTDILNLIGDEAGKFGITIAVEPLNTRETNFLLSVSDTARLVKEIAHPHVQVLADFYHMRMDGEPMSAMEDARGILRHVHIANSNGRVFPAAINEDIYCEFFGMLRKIGYSERVSIEAKHIDLLSDATLALEVLRKVSSPSTN